MLNTIVFLCVVIPFGVCDWPCIFPPPCSCDYNAKSADCSNKGLKEIPPILNLTGAWNINLKNNNITEVSDNALSNVTLGSLDISYNQISRFSDKAFNTQSPEQMYSLHIEFNKLERVPPVIGTFTNLLEMYIHGNPISSYSVEMFKNISKRLYTVSIGSSEMLEWPEAMDYLDNVGDLTIYGFPSEALPESALNVYRNSVYLLKIQNTNLKRLPLSLSNLSRLSELRLEGNNKLTEDGFPAASFEGLSKFRDITISNCGLQRLPKIFGNFSDLAFITIQSVPIEFVDDNIFPASVDKSMFQMTVNGTALQKVPRAFSGLYGLQNLWLINGKIQNIEEDDFSNMSNLYNLYLSGNPISHITDKAFRNIKDLAFLYLDRTSLTTVPSALRHLHNLQTVDVSYTNIACTCANLGWMKTWQKRQYVRFTGSCNNVEMDIDDYIKYEIPKC